MYYILIAIPSILYILVWVYNHKSPILFGLPFFYWFQIMLLVISSGFYALAVWVGDKDG